MMRSLSLLTEYILFSLSLILILPTPAFSSDPVNPPTEGAVITNTTDVNVIGTFREDENFSHDQSEGEIIIKIGTTQIYQSPIDQAETRFTDELSVTDGQTSFVKDFSFTTHPGEGNPNIATDRTIGFDAISRVMLSST